MVTNILQKSTMSVTELMRFTESICIYQNFLSKDPEAAKQFLHELQERLLKIMGVSSADTELEVVCSFLCVLARKAA